MSSLLIYPAHTTEHYPQLLSIKTAVHLLSCPFKVPPVSTCQLTGTFMFQILLHLIYFRCSDMRANTWVPCEIVSFYKLICNDAAYYQVMQATGILQFFLRGNTNVQIS